MFRRSARGLFDLSMAACALSALITATPVGELARRALRGSFGLGGPDVSLTAFFGPEPGATLAPAPRAALAALARAYGTAPALLQGFALASAIDPRTRDVSMDLTAAGRALLLARGAREDELATASGRLRAVGEAFPALGAELGSPDAALCALVLGPTEVGWAVARARAERAPLSLESLERHLSPASRQRAERVAGEALTLAVALELVWPVPRGTRVTSGFGARADPLSGEPGSHPGIDLAVPEGSPIAAAGDGVVERAGEDGLNGRFLVIDHGRGVTSAYCHASALLAARGERVARGQVVARSGNTGRSTGPHLHYQIAFAGTPVDPLALASAGERASSEAAR